MASGGEPFFFAHTQKISRDISIVKTSLHNFQKCPQAKTSVITLFWNQKIKHQIQVASRINQRHAILPSPDDPLQFRARNVWI